VPFSADEMKSIKTNNNISANLKLLYFTPQSTLAPEVNLTSPYFLYPDEKKIKGIFFFFFFFITMSSCTCIYIYVFRFICIYIFVYVHEYMYTYVCI
jgi:hypothetical protein